MTKPRRVRRIFGRVLLFTLLLLVAWIVLLGFTAQAVWSQVSELRISLRSGQLTSADVRARCVTVAATRGDLDQLTWLLRPARPVLPQLGFVPRYGDRLRSLPQTLDVAQAGLAFGDELCRAAGPSLPALDLPAEERISAAIKLLGAAPPDWAALEQSATRLSQRWHALPPDAHTHGLLAPYASQLRDVAPLLAELPLAVHTAQGLLPAAAELLGLAAPRRFLILGQNSFELRATGGFIGTLGEATIENGKLKALQYGNSADLKVAAPPGSAMPAPYARYLRLSQWYIRDANWWADFPTSARTLENFWALNGHPEPLDGVIAFDLYAVQELVRVFGGVTVPGYGPIKAEGTLEDIFTFYEAHGARAQNDKQFISALVKELTALLQKVPPARFPGLLIMLGHALDERHISMTLHDPQAAATLQEYRWDGAVRQTAGDYLQVVDADLSYGDVQAFIAEQLAYAVELDSAMTPLTATVTVTLTNHYDPWRAALTAQRVYGNCFNPATNRLERVPGCYGDYLRLYLPGTTAPLEIKGADSPFFVDHEAGRAVIGAYILLYPGETRSIQVRYRHHLPPNSGTYTLTAQKQAGTLARPFELTLSRGADRLVVQTDLWRDRQLVVGVQDGRLALLAAPGPLHPSNTRGDQQRAAFQSGRAAWEQGNHPAAIQIWRDGQALDAALDWARGLMMRGQAEQAGQLAAALSAEPDSAARAAYLRGDLALQTGQPDQAAAAYQQSLDHDPTNDAPRFALALLHYRAGALPAALAQLKQMDDPRSSLRYRAIDQLWDGDPAGAQETLTLLLNLAPDDRNALAMFRSAYSTTADPDWQAVLELSTVVLKQRPQDADWLQERARAAEKLNDPASALQDYEAITVVSPTNILVWGSVARLRLAVHQDQAGALAAYARMREIDPQAVPGYTGAASILIQAQDLATAETVLRQGVEAAPAVPQFPYLLGHVLRQQQRLAEALPLFETAARLSNDSDSYYYTALGDTYRALQQAQQAEAAYRHGLVIDPEDQAAARGLAALGIAPN